MTVTVSTPPAVSVLAPVTTRWVAVPGVTVMPDSVPVMAGVTVSVAVIVSDPDVFSVTLKVPTPSVKVAAAGSTAWPSLLVIATLPA